MPFETWLLFCATEALLCLSPGPAVLLVLSLSLGRGSGAGLRGSLGILAANTLYFALSATGVASLLLASWELFFALKWAGAAYLVWLGARMLFRRRSESGVRPPTPPGRAFAHGFATQAANPKTLLFFTALLPQFLDPAGQLATQVLVLGVSSVAIELGVLCGYAALAGRVRRSARGPRITAVFERAGGALLIAAGAGLAGLRRSS